MSVSTEDVTRALEVIPLPDLDGLSSYQVRGITCIWCDHTLSGDTAVDLGERKHRRLDGAFSTFPRSCPACVADKANIALLDHGSTCQSCIGERELCPTGRALYRLVRDGRRP